VNQAEIGVGIVGLGAMGKVHLSLIADGIPGLRLAAVADIDTTAPDRLGGEYRVPAYHSAEALYADASVDAVIVATLAETHASLIEKAAAAGKHVLTEKPLDSNRERIDRALAQVKANDVRLQVAFNRRFDRNFSFMRDEIEAGRIGRVISVHIVSRDPVLPGPPRTIEGMSGLFFDTTVHDFDMLRFLTGSEISMVHVLASSAIHSGPAIDSAVLLVRMSDGIAATIDNSQAAYGYDQRVETFGTKGALRSANERVNTVETLDEAGMRRPRLPYFFSERYRESYISQLGHFAAFIRDHVEPSPSGADGRAATVAALAAQRSLDEGRPVRIDEIA
jgi:myo-inositol 2-dehydrogenase/D-chiro-inositol 1-dehydrogenase